MLRFRIMGPVLALSALVASSTLVAVCASAALTAAAAFATGPGLPRTYDVQRVAAPNPAPSRNFGLVVVNGGDLNGDGKEDLLVPEGAALLSDGAGAEDGEIHVVSGADGALIRTILAPEPDPSATGTNRKPAFGASVGRLGDIASCPQGDGGDVDKLCDSSEIGPGDGVPEILAGAINADIGAQEDIGRVYVIDGASGAVLKRIDMPAADRAEQDPLTEQLGSSTGEHVRPRFGWTVLSPAGLVPCAGNAGVGACAAPSAVTIGDIDGGGRPDIVVGAPFVKDEEASNPSCNDTPDPDICERSGRLYVYRGEEITNTAAGRNPAVIESTPIWTVRNPLAQSDPPNPTLATEPELFGYSVAPVGDVGKCNAPVPAPGRRCLSDQIVQAPDDKPEVLVSAPRFDSNGFDSGAALLLDGETGALLHTYVHPEPQAGALLGLAISNQPAAGNLGDTALPDVYLPAVGQNVQFRGQGRGYILNGARTTPDAISLATLNDPTPEASGGFGTSSAGVGDLAGDARNELLIGGLAAHSPPQNPNTNGDVHIFDPLTERALQTISDPDNQAGSNFGTGLAPLGDLNGDGFLDLAAGAGRFEVTNDQPDIGRLYIFRSNNNPAPSAPSQEEQPLEELPFEGDFGDFGFFEEDFGGFDETGVPTVGRRVRLRSSRARISLKRKARRAPRVRLTGSISASSNEEQCEPSQRVLLERRRSGGPRRLRRYRTFQRTRTNSSGSFKSREFRPSRTYVYRAILPETEECPGAVSNQVRITVTRKAKRSPRRPRK